MPDLQDSLARHFPLCAEGAASPCRDQSSSIGEIDGVTHRTQVPFTYQWFFFGVRADNGER